MMKIIESRAGADLIEITITGPSGPLVTRYKVRSVRTPEERLFADFTAAKAYFDEEVARAELGSFR